MTDPTPEISQEAARAMLAALRDIEGMADAHVRRLPLRSQVRREAQASVDVARAAIALAEGRAP
jgi:hypothetical protein